MTKYFDSNINIRDSIVEMFAVFGLVFFSLGAGALGNFYSGDKTLSESNILNTFITASTSGFYIFIAVASFSRISGAHINPAVTISMWIHKKISSKKTLFYLLAQFTGGILGGLVWKIMYVAPLGVHSLSSEIFMTSIILGLSLEVVCTTFLAAVIFFLVLSTAIIKNTTKQIEDKIFAVKENIRVLNSEFGNVSLEYDYLSSSERLLEFQSQYFEDELIQKNINDIRVYNTSNDVNKIKNFKIIKE